MIRVSPQVIGLRFELAAAAVAAATKAGDYDGCGLLVGCTPDVTAAAAAERAAAEGDVMAVKVVLQRPVQCGRAGQGGGFERVACQLLMAGLDPASAGYGPREDPLAGRPAKAAALARAVIASGGSCLNAASTGSGQTVAHLAAKAGLAECLELLLAADPPAEIDALDSAGNTPLLLAAAAGRAAVARQLLWAGADAEIRGGDGQTAADAAAAAGGAAAALFADPTVWFFNRSQR